MNRMNRRQFNAAALGLVATASSSVRAEDDSPLAEHRVADISFRRIDLTWPRRVGRNAVKGVHGDGPRPEVCLLKTDLGTTGWGMIRGSRKSVTDIADRVMGQSVAALLVPGRGITAAHLLPLDFALHDLAGVVLEMPVWKMLAESDRDEPHVVPIYSGMIYFDDLDPPAAPAGIDKLIEECRWDYDYGYRQFKMKIGRGHKWMQPAAVGLERDILAVRTIAQEFPDCDILVDANNGYTIDDCLAFLEGVKGIPLFWIEEPFHENVADYRRLHGWMQENGFETTYLADGEARPDTPVLEQLQHEGLLDVRLEDIAGLGFTAWRQLMARLKQQHILASPHTWGSGLKTIYTAHLVGGMGNAPTVEGVTCSHADVDFGDNVIRDGKLQVSSAPGFGLTLKD
ncbi:MAG: enolase C-terminal domain-like protein [Maioricimonas sp. JB049]